MPEQALIEISGAGPAGLSAALAAAHAGRAVRVHERRDEVGRRFHGDFQGLENWTTEGDVLDELAGMGIEPAFDHTPFYEVNVFSPGRRCYRFRSPRPLFYLVRRGGEPGCLDVSLKRQALAAGVELCFSDTVRRLPAGGIVTQGPRRADAIASGYLFDCDLADGAWAAISDRLAPKGYAYLLVCGGRATLATCLFDDFHRERRYLERSVEFFSRELGMRMRNPRRFGGSGNFYLPRSARKGNILYAGESAGFQDPLFGFGIRWALISGCEAGRALADDDPGRYERVWKRRLRAFHQAAVTNRWFYERMGDRGYAAALARLARAADVREAMRRAYAPRLWKRIWYRLLASRRYPALPGAREHCDCTWCRCDRQRALSARSAG